MLKPIDYEALGGDAAQNFIVVDLNRLDCVEALNFWEQDERVQIIVRQDQLPQLRKLSQLVQIGVENDQIEAYVVQVDLFNLLIKFRSLEYFEGIAIDVEHPVWFNLCMPALNDGFLLSAHRAFA